MFKHDPYNKFKNDADLRRALKTKEIRLGVVGVALSFAIGLSGADITPEVLRLLMRAFL